MEGVSEGRIVHFVLNPTRHVAAMIVRAWSGPDSLVNLELHPDSDHNGMHNDHIPYHDRWRTSIKYDPDFGVGTWHWPERV